MSSEPRQLGQLGPPRQQLGQPGQQLGQPGRVAPPELPDPAQEVAVASDRGARIAAVVIALAWHTAIGLPAIGRHFADLALPWVVGAGWLLVAAVGGYAGNRLLRGRSLPAGPLVTVLLAVDMVVFTGAGGNGLFTAANWGWGTLGWFLVLVLWYRPTAHLLAALGAHAVIALAAVVGHGATEAADLSRYAMYVYGTSTLPVAVFVGRGVIASLARQRAATAAARAAVEAELAATEQARQARAARLDLVRATAGAVLDELADGRADPADPAVQQRCALAAARLRRLIAESDDVPDPLLHELRAAADLAERDGVPVDLVVVGTPPPLPIPVRRRLVEPLTEALATARDRVRVTVLADPGEVVVSLVAPVAGGTGDATGIADVAGPGDATGSAGSPDGSGDGVEHVHERDEELTWVQTRWRSAR